MNTDAANARKEQDKQKSSMRRRDVLRGLGLGAGAAAAVSAQLVAPAAADSVSNDEKRKARYQANSADVQNFYRVNRYPK